MFAFIYACVIFMLMFFGVNPIKSHWFSNSFRMCTQNTQIFFDLIFSFDMSLHKYIRLSVVHRFLLNAVRRPMSAFINLCPRTNISVSRNPYESIHLHTYARHLADWFEDFMLHLRWIVLFKATNVNFNNQISHGSNSPETKQNSTVPIYFSARSIPLTMTCANALFINL